MNVFIDFNKDTFSVIPVRCSDGRNGDKDIVFADVGCGFCFQGSSHDTVMLAKFSDGKDMV